METFGQILELDEDEDERDFSRPMVKDYFAQAVKTFEDMDHAIERKDLGDLSNLGHFLKGSSAALGLSRVQDSCEKIQHYGHLRNEEKGTDLLPTEALDRIVKTVERAKIDYKEAKAWLTNFIGNIEDDD
jgi:HPt (histidine-containing phosphotransfer) domain-containing protein